MFTTSYKVIYFMIFMTAMSSSYATNLRLELPIETIGNKGEQSASNIRMESLVFAEGDNLTGIFNRFGLSTTTLYKVLDADLNKILSKLKTGSEIELFIDEDNILQKINLKYNGKLMSSFSRIKNNYKNNNFHFTSNINDHNGKAETSDVVNQDRLSVTNNDGDVGHSVSKKPKTSEKVALVNIHAIPNEWRVLAPRVITNGEVTIKNDHNGTTWVEFNKNIDYPQLYVDGYRVLYSQSTYMRRIGSDMPIWVYFQYGNNMVIKHSSGYIRMSLKGYSKAWKDAEGYLTDERPKWHIQRMSGK